MLSHAPRQATVSLILGVGQKMNPAGTDRYLLPVERTDWDALLANWAQLIPAGSCRWLMSRFGELFFEQKDGKIGMLQVSAFDYKVVALDKNDFRKPKGVRP